jgi:hypothetical protein
MKITNLCIILSAIFLNSAFASEEKVVTQFNQAPEVQYYPESSWGQAPVKVTKELIYRQYPDLLLKKEAAKTEQLTNNNDSVAD